ncbi:glycosyltransferase family A protein [Streptomyces sp. HNM0574]|uniref:glycosyltransferase family 2 protein n=1 Tax=Streptomyces sp. HNM0574 TaxID=2714954 RepID=UPI00146F69A0|nr:glycosyltransferase family A protein [Streptomyces sp. HNM0574]NLU67385.1 glycosyltransferase [Streptomyces sp. HNM0574]
MTEQERAVSEPDVTVIVGVYNGMPYFRRCLASLEEQTIGPGRLEAVVVDDGSTDGSGEFAERFARGTDLPVRVVHQENSGGPSRPRNVGLGLARGRYVFFLDADDYLGEEALERMVAAADRNKTDVVLGRITGVNRKAPRSMFTENVERTDPYSSNVTRTMSAEKLFRRSLLERHGLRFTEGMTHGEDTCFTLEAYVRADGLSVVADYPCLYILGRTDGGNLTSVESTTDGFRAAEAQLGLIARLLPPGEERDLLSVRPFRMKILRTFRTRMRREPEELWQECFDHAVPLLERYLTPGIERRLRADERLRLHFLAERRSDLFRDVLKVMAARDAAARTPAPDPGRDRAE